MHRKGYRMLIAALLLLIAVLLAAMVYIGGLLLRTPPQTPVMPAATPELKTSRDFQPDRSVLYSVPEGVLTAGDGRKVKLSSLRGRPTVLIFWSSWCGDCKEALKEEFPQAAQSARSMGAAVHLVCREGVREDSRAAAEAVLAQLGLQEQTLMDPGAALYEALGLHWVPSTAILDAQGRLMYTASNLPDAAALAALLTYVNNPAAQTMRFVETKLTAASGAPASGYRIEEGTAIPGNTVLSESLGLMMLCAVQLDDRAGFDRAWQAVNAMSAGGLTAWRTVDGTRAEVNAALDDLRIIEALAMADEKWGLYGHDAQIRAEALYDRCVRDGLMRDFASLEKAETGRAVTLCYMDAAAMRAAAAYDPRWQEAADKAAGLLNDPAALVSEQLPLYYARYDAEKQAYEGDSLQMNEACVAVLNAVRAGVAQPRTLDWLENTLAAGPVYARYGADGQVLPGYEFESNATYSLLVQIGAAAGRRELARMALERMERRRSFDPAMTGGYGEAAPTEHFTFDELEAALAWLAWMAME